MRKSIKGLSAKLMTSVLAVSASAAAAPVFAADETYTLTVDSADVSKRTYEVYQIFSGNLQDNVLTELAWGNGITAAGKTALGDAGAYAGSITEGNAPTVAAELAAYLENPQKVGAKAKADGTSDVAELDSLAPGYYLIKDVTDFNDKDDANSRYILKVVEDVTISPKTDVPSLDKNIVEGESKVKANTASIGDVINFQLDSKVPDMTGYNKYFFVVSDDMEDGLTFNNDVVVKINNAPIAATAYDVITDTDTNNFEIVFKNFIQYNTASYVGKPITVTYSATLNENADLYTDSNDNTVSLKFSNNPNHDYTGDGNSEPGNPDKPSSSTPTGKTPDSTTKTFTTAIKFKKVDKDTGAALSGAKFRLSGEGLHATKVDTQYFKLDATGTYYQLKDGTYTTDAPTAATEDKYASKTQKYSLVTDTTEQGKLQKVNTVVTSGTDGVISFKGLAPGTYTLTELEAPAKYNKLAEPITIVITGTASNEGWAATADGNPMSFNTTNSMFETNIENVKGSTLPGTGGIGTTIFYIVGSLMVCGAIVLFVVRKRMNIKEQ